MVRGQHCLSFLLVLSICGSAFGQRFDYVSGYSGWFFQNNYQGGSEIPLPTVNTGTFKDGWLLGGAIGKNLCNCNRVEAEFFFRNVAADSWSNNIIGTVNWAGRLNSFSTLTNVLHDFRIPGSTYFTPYLGGGIGSAYLDGDFNTPTTEYRLYGSVFAFQGIAGVKTQLTSQCSLLTEYRYFGTSKEKLVNQSTNAATGLGFDSHNVLVGLSLSR